MAFPQLGYQYIRPLYPSDRQAVGGTRSGAAELSPAGTLSNVLSSMYAAPYAAAAAAQAYGAFLPYTTELPIFPQLGSQYEMKDSPGVQHAAFSHHHPAFYPYGQYQFGDPSRPKNATRESTSTLKAWLNEHRKNPYPTKGEKIMLAIITKMTLTQVSTWFANARRRLKKENKMTWTPRNRSEDEEDEENIDLEKNDEDEPQKLEEKGDTDVDTVKRSSLVDEADLLDQENIQEKELISVRSDSEVEDSNDLISKRSTPSSPPTICQAGQAQQAQEEQTVPNHLHHHHHHHQHQQQATQHLHHHHHHPHPIDLVHRSTPIHHGPTATSNATSVIHSPPASTSKPKLWSLAEIATSSDKTKESSEVSVGPGSSTPQPIVAASSPSRSPSAACHFPNNAVLSRPIYYSTPFYPGYTNYGSFGHLHSHHGPSTTPSANSNPHFNGLTQTVLNRAEALAKECKLRSQAQVDLSKDSAYEMKKDPIEHINNSKNTKSVRPKQEKLPPSCKETPPPFLSTRSCIFNVAILYLNGSSLSSK